MRACRHSRRTISRSAMGNPYVAAPITVGEMVERIWGASDSLQTSLYDRTAIITSVIANGSRFCTPRHVYQAVQKEHGNTESLAYPF